jgi:hypothetical protein
VGSQCLMAMIKNFAGAQMYCSAKKRHAGSYICAVSVVSISMTGVEEGQNIVGPASCALRNSLIKILRTKLVNDRLRDLSKGSRAVFPGSSNLGILLTGSISQIDWARL